MNKIEVVEYINKLKGYEGYVQFSDIHLRECDIFEGFQDISITPTDGFVYEAHFANKNESIMIRQQNAQWLISKTDIANIEKKDMELYALEKTTHLKDVKSSWIKMAQIWKSESDELCDGMDVMKLNKVVFAGFCKDKGEES